MVRRSASNGRLILAALWCVWIAAGCSRPSGTGSGSSLHTHTTGSGESAAHATEALVKHYLEALYDHRYREAYHHLSADSQRAHSLAEFESQCQAGVTAYDLSQLSARAQGAKRMEVTVQLADEPGSHTFVFVREGGEWRLIFQGGKPAVPYPELE